MARSLGTRRGLFARLLVVQSVGALLSGCVGLWNPYVHPEIAHPYESSPVSLVEALKYANDARARYRDALTHQGRLSTGLGTLLIPLTGVISYQGITGVNSHAIAATSLGGAAALGVGTYLHSTPRQLIYASASSAITCAIGVVAPLQLSKGDAELLAKAAAIDIPRMLVGARAKPTAAETKDLDRVRRIENSLIAARTAQATFETAAAQLIAAVDGIIDKADKQIAATLPDPRVLSTGLGGLVPPVKVSLDELATAEDGRVLVEKRRQALSAAGLTDNEIDQIDQILTLIITITDRINNIARRQLSIAGCAEALDQVPTAMRLIPDGREISIEGGRSYEAVPVGGKPPYFASVLSKPAAGTLEAEVISDAGGYVLRIKGTAAAAPGPYRVIVRDSSAQEPLILNVQIQAN